MRQGQNKQRMRGRNTTGGNNNRKGPNPLTRSYESNGPDVKIRGTAHHVGEKYLQLARDALTSGDPVMAESYLQHAEHYFRLIARAQLAQAQAQAGYQRAPGEIEVDDEDDDDMGGLPDRFSSPQERQQVVALPVQAPPQPQPPPQANFYAAQPQPFQERPERPQYNNDRPPHDNRPDQQRQDNRGPRQDRQFKDRVAYAERNSYQDRSLQNRGDGERAPQQERFNNQDRNNQQRGPDQQRRQRGDFRNDAPRQEQPRQEQPRSDNGRPDQVRFEISRPEIAPAEPLQPARVETPRHEPRPAPAFDAAPSLPAFITAPVRIAPETFAHEPELPDDAAGTGVPRPRRRRRTRAEMEADQAKLEAAKIPAGE